MKALVHSVVAVGLMAACASSSGTTKKDAKTETFEVKDPIRLALQPVSVPPELQGAAAPLVFEQTLCNRLFEINKKQVMCSDEVKVFIENKRQGLVLGNGEENMDALLQSLDTPRRVNLIAAKSGDSVAMTVIIQNKAGKTLDRFQITVKADGADVIDRANEAALKIVQVPPETAKQ